MQKYIVTKKINNSILYLQNNPHNYCIYTWVSDRTKATTFTSKRIATFYVKIYCTELITYTNIMVIPLICDSKINYYIPYKSPRILLKG